MTTETNEPPKKGDSTKNLRKEMLGEVEAFLPHAEVLKPFSKEDSESYLWCVGCLALSELDKKQTDLFFRIAKSDDTNVIFDETKHFFVSPHCPQCNEEKAPNVWIVTKE